MFAVAVVAVVSALLLQDAHMGLAVASATTTTTTTDNNRDDTGTCNSWMGPDGAFCDEQPNCTNNMAINTTFLESQLSDWEIQISNLQAEWQELSAFDEVLESLLVENGGPVGDRDEVIDFGPNGEPRTINSLQAQNANRRAEIESEIGNLSTLFNEAASQRNATSNIQTCPPLKEKYSKSRQLHGKHDVGTSRSNQAEESIAVCIATTYNGDTTYETRCVDPDELENRSFMKKSSKGSYKKRKGKNGSGESDKQKGSRQLRKERKKKITYACRCCDPLLEGDSYPSFCGGQICYEQQTLCDLQGGSSKGKGKTDKDDDDLAKVKGNRKSGKRHKRFGVAICVGNVTMCVDELDPLYLGSSNVTCGCCPSDKSEFC